MGQITQAVGTEQGHVHGTHQRDEGFVGADVGRCTVATDVLFASGEREAVRLFSVNVNAAANDAPRHQPEVGFGARKDAVERPATGDRTAKGLSFTDHDVSAVVSGCLNDPERNGLHTNDERRVITDDGLHRRQSFVEHTQRVGLFEVDAAGTSCFLQGVHVECPVFVVGDGTDFNFGALTVVVHDRQLVRWREG